MAYSPLLTDLYELTMLAGYHEQGMAGQPAVFDLYFRANPFNGSYAVFAGLEQALEILETACFSAEELGYLQGLGLFVPGSSSFCVNFVSGGRSLPRRKGAWYLPTNRC